MIDIHEVEAPEVVKTPEVVNLPDAKPSQILRSVPQDRLTTSVLRSSDGKRMCAVGHLLQHAGYNFTITSTVIGGKTVYPLAFEGQALLRSVYGLGTEEWHTMVNLNDNVGIDAVIEYLEHINK